LVIVCLVCAMIAALALSISVEAVLRLTPAHWLSLLFLFVLYLLADANLIPWQFPNNAITITVSTAINITLVLLFGPAVALPFVFVAVLFGELWARRPLPKLLFNVALVVLSTSAAWLAFSLFGQVGESPFASPSQVIAWLLASVAHVVVNSSLLALIISASQQEPFFGVWRQLMTGAEMQQWIQPLLGALIAVLQLHSPWALVLAVIPLIVIYVSFRRYMELNQQTRRVIETLADALDQRDPITFQHSQRVTHYVERIIQAIDSVSVSDADTIISAARIHDLGKIGIADRYLHKPSALTPEERLVMERHPVIGAQILQPLSLYQDALSIVRHHHERWDGCGYPDGLAGERIPFGARILAVADSFDVMTSNRPYRGAISVDRALAELEKGRGTQFDPAIVDAFLKEMRDTPANAPVAPRAASAAAK
jgi:HD-GYP domain-containing protein (c-di-GMP phosphodiesterase class II)